MLLNSLIVVLKDSGVDKDLRIVPNLFEARKFNNMKYGVFFSVNGFKDRRIKENLININAWAIDIDHISKIEQQELISRSPLPPSLVVESKNGYHVYWFAEGATIEKYSEILETRLIPFFKADIKAKDICRILRFPNFYHWKDENNPYLVKIVWDKPKLIYTEQKMISAFRPVKTVRFKNIQTSRKNDIDNLKALEKLSGTPELRNEKFNFKKNTSGYQILVDGKPTSSWIDKKGLIGSYERGGCTWINWIMWYGYDKQQALEIGKKYGIE